MSTFQALLILAFIGVSLGLTDGLNLFQRSSSGCPSSGPVSCQNTTVQSNLCCFESPGGLLLQTQFWHTSTGPADSWTIHGLWSDYCDLTHNENCDPSRDYTDISILLSSNGATDTLQYMQQYWLDIDGGQNEQFWEHEWATHGTCLSTLKPSCLPSGSATGRETVAYFETVVNLFKTLPTYIFLSNAGIEPSSTITYTLNQFISALQTGSGGFKPVLQCSGSTVTGVYWYFNLKGSVIDGTFIPIDAPEASSCPSTGLIYPPKSS